MRWLPRKALFLLLAAAAFPFAVLTAVGVMRPAEGFCVEQVPPDRLSELDAPAWPRPEPSHFTSPELGESTMRIPFVHRLLGYADHEEWLGWRWPVCERSRRLMHDGNAYIYEAKLKILGEPDLRHGSRNTSVYRIVTAPSFSRVPIALRLEVPGGQGPGTLTTTWLEDDGTKPDPTKATPEGDDAWRRATLPRRSQQRTLTAQQTAALQTLFADLPDYQMFNLDGIGLAIEAMHGGRREVRAAFLYEPPFKTGILFSAMARASGIPKKVLEQGDVDFAVTNTE